jgi:hypothetical protein
VAEQSKVVKYGSTTIGVGSGNAIAYFALPYLEAWQGAEFADPVVAVAMGGALVAIFLLELGKVGRGIKYVFDRMFPPAKES